MSDMKINPVKSLKGEIRLKGDKSVSHRAVMIASIAEGRSRIKNFLDSEDCLYTLKAFRRLGADIKESPGELTVEGKGLRGLRGAKEAIYLGNSGTSMRLIAGILAGQDFETTLTGDESLSKRPMDRIIEPLMLMGADIRGVDGKYAPLVIRGGRLKAVHYKTKVASAQVKSAVILAGLYADGVTVLEEPERSRDHTERMLGLFGAKLAIDNLKISVYPGERLKGRLFAVPGDISSAAFFITGALLLDGSEVVVKEVLYNRTRLGFIDILKDMGADITIENRRFNGYEDVCDITAKSSALKGKTIEKDMVPSVIDELPILMAAAVFAEGRTEIKGAGELRVKETDRIMSMSTALKAMGARLFVEKDAILIEGTGVLKGAEVNSFGDHRTAMSLVIASLRAQGGSEVKGVDCINTSFPGFFMLLDSLKQK